MDESDIPDTFLMAAEPLADYEEEEPEEETVKKKSKKEKKAKPGRNGEVVIIQAAKIKKAEPDTRASAAYVIPPKPVSAASPAPAVSSRPAFDESSVHVGSRVFHKAFGHGVITELGNGKIRVSFNGELKPFVFPAAFLQGFLKLEE